jgi:hypothetical protein
MFSCTEKKYFFPFKILGNLKSEDIVLRIGEEVILDSQIFPRASGFLHQQSCDS